MITTTVPWTPQSACPRLLARCFKVPYESFFFFFFTGRKRSKISPRNLASCATWTGVSPRNMFGVRAKQNTIINYVDEMTQILFKIKNDSASQDQFSTQFTHKHIALPFVSQPRYNSLWLTRFKAPTNSLNFWGQRPTSITLSDIAKLKKKKKKSEQS